MHPLLQVALGLLPAIIALVLCLVFRKIRPVRAVPLLCACVLLSGAAFFAFLTQKSPASSLSTPVLERDAGAAMVYAAAEEGDLDLARALLADLRAAGEDETYTLCAARLCALEGQWSAAKILYEKAGGTALEYTQVAAVQGSLEADPVLLAHWEGDTTALSGLESNFSEAETIAAVRKAVDAESGPEGPWGTAARTVIQAATLYETYLTGSALDTEEAEKLIRKLGRACEEAPALLGVRQVRLSRLKLQVLTEDYKGLAAAMDENAGHDELLVASELLLNRYVKQSYFPEDYGQAHAQACAAVRRQLERVLDGAYADENKAARTKVERYLDELEYAENHPAMAQMEAGLLAYARAGGTDASKVYLQLARIENHIGNETAADAYLSASLDTVGDCADGSYTRPMYEIVGIIADKDDPERLKDVAGYVDRVLENKATVRLPEDLNAAQPSEGGETAEREEDFAGYLTDKISQKRAAVNIISVDASGFDTVTVTVGVDGEQAYTAEELEALLEIKDCGAQIADFTVEKITYSRANVLLCCDVSGSMGGAGIENLRQAVRLFVENQKEDEQVALVTFSSGVEETYGFGTGRDTLLAAADGLYASGGTEMYGAILHSIGQFGREEGELNVAVLLSDGEDNSPRSVEDIYQEVGGAAAERGVVIYTMGLGSSVDSAYLNAFSEATGGSYLYVNDAQTLSAFYAYLDSLMFNQYRITFRAEDTLSRSRDLRVSLNTDALTYDVAYYSLDGGAAEEGEGMISLQGKSIAGLDTRLIFRGAASTKVRLLGSGFVKEESVSVSLKGNLDYDLEAVFVDDKTYELTIPAGIAAGTYDLHVTLGGKKAILDKELTVAAPGSQKTVAFGPYVFTAYDTWREGERVTLSGYVTLNGWLRFQGNVSLTGDLQASQIRMEDMEGAYLQYYEGSSVGLAKIFAQNNWTLPILPLGQLTLYNDTTHDPSSEEYEVAPAALPLIYVSGVLKLSAPGLSLYPDRIVLDANAFTTALPYQDKLLKKAMKNGGDSAKKLADDLFSFEVDSSFKVLLTAKNIGMDFTAKVSHEDQKVRYPINLLNLHLDYDPAAFEVKINTIENKYFVKFMVRLMFLKADGVGLSLSWDGALMPEEIRFYVDRDITTTFGSVPVTFSDFEAAMKGIDLNNLSKLLLEGKATASAYKVSALFPGLKDWVGDVSLCSFKDATVEIAPFRSPHMEDGPGGYVGLSTDFYLLDAIKLASAKIQAGNFTYTNRLLNMKDEDVAGLNAWLRVGVIWKADNCDIDLSGAVDLALTDKVMGVTVDGTCKVDVSWWIFTKHISENGQAMIGVYKAHNGDTIFTVRASSYSSDGVSLNWSKNSGLGLEKVELT